MRVLKWPLPASAELSSGPAGPGSGPADCTDRYAYTPYHHCALSPET